MNHKNSKLFLKEKSVVKFIINYVKNIILLFKCANVIKAIITKSVNKYKTCNWCLTKDKMILNSYMLREYLHYK